MSDDKEYDRLMGHTKLLDRYESVKDEMEECHKRIRREERFLELLAEKADALGLELEKFRN